MALISRHAFLHDRHADEGLIGTEELSYLPSRDRRDARASGADTDRLSSRNGPGRRHSDLRFPERHPIGAYRDSSLAPPRRPNELLLPARIGVSSARRHFLPPAGVSILRAPFPSPAFASPRPRVTAAVERAARPIVTTNVARSVGFDPRRLVGERSLASRAVRAHGRPRGGSDGTPAGARSRRKTSERERVRSRTRVWAPPGPAHPGVIGFARGANLPPCLPTHGLRWGMVRLPAEAAPGRRPSMTHWAEISSQGRRRRGRTILLGSSRRWDHRCRASNCRRPSLCRWSCRS